MKLRNVLFGSLLFCTGQVLAGAAPSVVDPLDRFKALAGEWEGPYEWSGARSEKGFYRAQYYLTGLGATVVENLITASGEAAMTSVYHKDGEDLRITHYCATRVQTRMRAAAGATQGDTVRFSFVDATNLKSPAAPHVHDFEMRFRDANHITLYFIFTADGKSSYETIDLTRIVRK